MPSMTPNPPWERVGATPLTASQMVEQVARVLPSVSRDLRRIPPVYMTSQIEPSEGTVSTLAYETFPYYSVNGPSPGVTISTAPKPSSKLLPGHPLFKKVLRTGSMVRVVEKITHAVGWRNTWVSEMDPLVGDGQTYRVVSVTDSGVSLAGVRCRFPKESLEQVFYEGV